MFFVLFVRKKDLRLEKLNITSDDIRVIWISGEGTRRGTAECLSETGICYGE
jgi:hypothetical protein